MVRTPCSNKLQKRKGLWNEEGDERAPTYAPKQEATGGQKRSGKSSKDRSQKSDPKHKIFTPQEEELVIQLHAAIGSRWAIIAQQLPGRTDNDVKILWNSKLRKKLSAMGIDPVTHKPFSQILADYGNIGAFPKARTRFTSLSRDLKNAIILRSEDQQPHNHHLQDFGHHFSSENSRVVGDLDLYSQLQAVNLVKEASTVAKSMANNQETSSSFSWSDFFLDQDAFLAPQGDEQVNEECDRTMMQVKPSCDEDNNGGVMVVSSFEASSSSNASSSFVEAMIQSQDEMFSHHLPCFCEEPFYY